MRERFARIAEIETELLRILLREILQVAFNVFFAGSDDDELVVAFAQELFETEGENVETLLICETGDDGEEGDVLADG